MSENITARSIIVSAIIITIGFYITLTKCSETLAKSIEQAGSNARSHFSSPGSLHVQLEGALDEGESKKTLDDKRWLMNAFKGEFDTILKEEIKDKFIKSNVKQARMLASGAIMFYTEVTLKDQNKVDTIENHLWQDGFGGFFGEITIPINSQKYSKYIKIEK